MRFAEAGRQAMRVLLAAAFMLATACGGDGGAEAPGDGRANPQRYVYSPPPPNGDGWRTADARTAGVDVAFLEDLMQEIRAQNVGFKYVDGILIARHGQLLFSEQIRTKLDFTDDWAGNRDPSLHVMQSVTKSFTATLIGIAIDQGHIPGVDVRVHNYFADKLPLANWADEKADATLADWLTMRHGYLWDEWQNSYFDPANVNYQMNAAADPIRFLLERPLATTPGTRFAYSTGISFALGRIIQLATGERTVDFLQNHLLEPLDIRRFTYWTTSGQIHTGSSLYLTLRDMAKLGQLYLDGGTWNGRRIVSQAWVEEAVTPHVVLDAHQYGYQWWMRTFRAGATEYLTYHADGLGGQYIFVFPALDAVVAVTGAAYEQAEKDQRDLTRIIQEYILPSLL